MELSIMHVQNVSNSKKLIIKLKLSLMLQRYFYFLFFLLPLCCLSQEASCDYELKFRPIPQKDSLVTEIYYLDIKNEKSVFRSEYTRGSDSLLAKTGYAKGRDAMFITSLYATKNKATKEVRKIITTLMGTRFFININEPLVWKIEEEKQQIGSLSCQKASVDYGGRKWTAWFSTEISLQEGPYIFSGLPGLIVKIYDEHLDYDFSLMQVKHLKNIELFLPNEGTEMSWTNFRKMTRMYYNDPFYEVKSSGMPIAFGDENNNRIQPNLKLMKEKHKKRMKRSGNNLLEKDKAAELD